MGIVIADASRIDLVYVRRVIIFSLADDDARDLRWLPLIVPGIHSRCLEATPFKIASSPSGLQVFVLFNALGSHSYGAFRGSRSGLCPCSVAYPRGATCPFDCLIRVRVQRLDIACESRAGGNELQERSPDTPTLLCLSPQ